MFNPFDLLKNPDFIKEKTEQIQRECAQIEEEGSAGGAMVKVRLNGKFEMVDIKLDPICVDNRDVKMLEDLILAAHRDAARKIADRMQSQAGSLLNMLSK